MTDEQIQINKLANAINAQIATLQDLTGAPANHLLTALCIIIAHQFLVNGRPDMSDDDLIDAFGEHMRDHIAVMRNSLKTVN